MKPPQANFKAFTLIEVLIVLAVILTLAIALLPALVRRAQARSSRLNCSNNLKMIGLAFKTWAIDNRDLYPMEVLVVDGGAREAAITNLPLVFQVMSNELSTPKNLACPNDNNRVSATNFLSLRSPNISYFVGMDAADTNPASILAGDSNITNRMGVRAGILYSTTKDPGEWKPGRHGSLGNILLGDGSVQQVTTEGLRKIVAATGFQTNRLLMP